jgi:hypothetical protein
VPRTARKARNMAVFRSVNERISDLAIARDDSPEQLHAFICECSQIGCTESLRLPLATYAQVRGDPATFVVLPGHEDSEGEEVLVRLPDYLIVRDKTGVAAELGLPHGR